MPTREGRPDQPSPWRRSNRYDPLSRMIADRHYNRQKVGSSQFVPPGRCLVLRTDDDSALWVTSFPFPEFVRHQWPGAWVNSLFRNEGDWRASDLIRFAVAHSRAEWETPALGIVSFVDAGKIRHKRDPGRCYLRAGWERVGMTKGGLIAFRQLPDLMPEPLEVPNNQLAFSMEEPSHAH